MSKGIIELKKCFQIIRRNQYSNIWYLITDYSKTSLLDYAFRDHNPFQGFYKNCIGLILYDWSWNQRNFYYVLKDLDVYIIKLDHQ